MAVPFRLLCWALIAVLFSSPLIAQSVGRNLLIFIDESFAIAAQRDRVLQGLERDRGAAGAGGQPPRVYDLSRGRSGDRSDTAGGRDRPPPAPGGRARWRSTIKLRRIQQRLVFSLRDPLSGKMLWKELDFQP